MNEETKRVPGIAYDTDDERGGAWVILTDYSPTLIER